VRRLRHAAKRSFRGSIANTWDRLQGWVAATLIGILSALIAFAIIRVEGALFDLKEGFCSTNWGTSKRFCCTPHNRSPSEEECGDWVEWGQVLNPGHGETWFYGMAEFAPFGIIAVSHSTACRKSI
jgi:chloride channel 3/4/5